MSWTYDESLSENPFFLYIQKQHRDIIQQAISNNCIICIPRLGSLDCSALSNDDVFEHVLVPISSISNGGFTSLNQKRDFIVEDRCIICENKKDIRILFEETFYIDKFSKYVLYCIDKPLSRKSVLSEHDYCLLNLQECIKLLEDKHFHILEYIHKYLENVDSQLHTNDLNALKNIVSVWYRDLIKVCDFKIKLAVETYIQHCIYNRLFSIICNYTAESDAGLNKIIRNITDIQLKDLGLHAYIDGISAAKFEFTLINNYTTILDKVLLLKRALKAVSSKTTKLFVTTDITLKLFVFLIIKSNVNNWVANLTYISQFKYAVDAFDEYSFFITTLEAAIEFIKSGKLHQNNDIATTQLFSLIKTDNLDAIKSFIQNESLCAPTKCHPLCNCNKCNLAAPFNINSCDDKGLTALHVACFYGHPQIVEYLINQNVATNVFDYSEMMPIHYAALKGHQNALLLLLHAGTLISPKNSGGNMPLHLASNNGHENCVKALVYFSEQRGSFIDINCTNNNGDTPLHLASKWGFYSIVNILIQYGADRSVKNKRFQTPLDIAQNDHLKNLLLPKKIDCGKDNVQCLTPTNFIKPNIKSKKIDVLLKSIENNDIPLMCYYLGIPMPQTTWNNVFGTDVACHPLCNCSNCLNKQTDNCETSVNEKSLNINSSNLDGYSSLHVAALCDNTNILRILLDSGANVNLQTKNMCTPLHLACINQCTNAVQELLKCGGCDVHIQDSQGNTSLHYAAMNNNAKIAEIILSNTSIFNIKNNEGKTPVQIAKDKEHFNIVRLFINKSQVAGNNVKDLFS